MKQIIQSHNLTGYEYEPHWRTISITKYDFSSKHTKQKPHLYFPYMQFLFTKNHSNLKELYVYASTKPYPSPSIIFMLSLTNGCLGDYHIQNHKDTITKFWLTTFNLDYDDTNNFHTLLSLTNQYKNNLWNCNDPELKQFITTRQSKGYHCLSEIVTWAKTQYEKETILNHVPNYDYYVDDTY